MIFVRHFPRLPIVLLAACFLGGAPLASRAQVPGQALDQKAFEQGMALLDQGKYAESIAQFASLVEHYPTSPLVAQASFRIGYAHYLAGEYDEAIAALEALRKLKVVEPAMIELADSMVPQILMAQASKLPPEDKTREGAFREAALHFSEYLKKYPASREYESANYSRAICLYQIAQYDNSAAALRENLQKFPKSETILDSQYLLGLTLGTIANLAADKASAADSTIDKNYEEAEKLLRDVIARRTNLALLNDSQFQIGEILFTRGSHAPEKEKPAILGRALEAYRGVYPKEAVVDAQKKRVEDFRQRARQALEQSRDVAARDYFNRVADKEGEKVAIIEARADQTVTAKVKSGMIFFQLSKLDEARVMFSFSEPFTEDEDLKKQIAYFTTLTYAIQNKVEKALESYDAFQAAHKGDKIAENLDLVMGGMFLSPDPKINNAEKAIEFFKRGIEGYPDGRYTSELMMQQAMAQIQLGKFDEAQKVLQDFIARKPAPELAVAAEFGLGIVLMKTDKTDEAIKTFHAVRDKYAGTPQAEDSAYYAAQLALAKDPKAAVAELNAFVAKYPQSERMPDALYALGQGQMNTGQKDAAFKTFKQLAEKYPESGPAPFSYFERARSLAADQKYDAVMALLKEFMTKYEDNDALYQAYDFVAQIQTSQGKGMEALETYEEFVKKKPRSPFAAEALVKLGTLWRAYGEAQGPYLALNEEKRAEWKKGIDASLAASEKVVAEFPESPAVGSALGNMLDVLRLQQRVKLKTDADIEAYLMGLAAKAQSNAGLHSKIIFTLAGYTFDRDKAKALAQMQAVYKPELKYGAEEIDLYGLSLIETKRYDEALKVYEKIAADYPTPANTDATKAPRDIQEAQAIALFGISKTLQAQAAQITAQNKPAEAAKKSAEAGAKSGELKRLYGWSKKALEANYPLAQSLHDAKKDDEAIKLLLEVIKAQSAPAELRARAMLLLGKIHESNGRHDFAIDNYMKIAAYYGGVADVAAEGLWLGGQLLERQASGQIPMPTPAPKAAGTPKPAGK